MNPSASGWIPKFLTLVDKQQILNNHKTENQFYNHLKTTGFLYGISKKTLPNHPLSNLKLSTNEFTKINLFHSLLFTFFIKNPLSNSDQAIQHILDFYSSLEKGKTSFLYKFSMSQSSTEHLEYVLSSRLQEGNTFLKKNENTVIPYSLLYIDVLAFSNYLSSNINLKQYEQELESNLINYCYLALKAKKYKDKNDQQTINQFTTSTAFLTLQNQQDQFLNLESLQNQTAGSELENKYILDLCCLAVWNDKILDTQEYQFLKELAFTLQISEKQIEENLLFIKQFSEDYAKTISLFEYSNPINQLYKQASATVKLLIVRNKNRLLKELSESGELVVLLGQSTFRELSTDEKDKVKEQLLDICKTVPSLTIFLIPGGSLLLPLLAKYIPSLLPSAFQENRINTKNETKQ